MKLFSHNESGHKTEIAWFQENIIPNIPILSEDVFTYYIKNQGYYVTVCVMQDERKFSFTTVKKSHNTKGLIELIESKHKNKIT